jgi:hypothetical protein
MTHNDTVYKIKEAKFYKNDPKEYNEKEKTQKNTF